MTQTLQPVRPPFVPAKRRPRRKQLWGLGILAAAVLGVLGYMLSAYVPPDITTSRVPMNGDYAYYALLITHIGTGTIATVTGLLQFWPWLRRTRPKVHRWVGRMYFFAGVFPSMILVFPMALISHGGLSNAAALFVMDALWIFTAVSGYRTARARKFADHRKWMIRNYAVTLASIATRPWTFLMQFVVSIPVVSPMFHGDMLAMARDVASTASWLGIVVNIAAVEIYLQRRPKKARLAAAQRAEAAVAVG